MGDIGPQRRRYEVLPEQHAHEDTRERRDLERDAESREHAAEPQRPGRPAR